MRESACDWLSVAIGNIHGAISAAATLTVLAISVLASLLGIWKAMRVAPNEAIG